MVDPKNDTTPPRISPNSVVVAACIDLTTTDTYDDANDGNLQSIRKRLKSTPLPMKIKQEVVELDLMDDDDDRKPAAVNHSEVQVVVNPENMENEMAMETGEAANDTDDLCAVVGTKNCVRLPHMRQHCTEHPFQNNASSLSLRDRTTTNAAYCDLCYCYVCDVPVKECCGNTHEWKDGPSPHCLATDQGVGASFWITQRKRVKQAKSATATAAAAEPDGKPHLRCECPLHDFSQPGDGYETEDSYGYPYYNDEPQDTEQNREQCRNCLCFICDKPAAECQKWFQSWEPHCNAYATPSWEQKKQRVLIEELGSGPFAPDRDDAIARDKSLQKCRHCNWYSRFERMDSSYWREWCHACGRVASEQVLKKPSQQSVPFLQPTPDQILLGTKEIPFTLHAHDPRKMKAYEKRWSEQSDWTFDESEQQKELFRHRIGARPTLNSILACIPIVEHDNIPVDGSTSKMMGPTLRDETDALLLESPSDLTLLREVARNAPSFGQRRDRWSTIVVLDGDLEATWDSDTNRGTIRLRVYVLDIKSYAQGTIATPTGLTRFLAAWFGVLPFKLSDLGLNLKAQEQPIVNYDTICRSAPDSNLEGAELANAKKSATEQEKIALEAYNAQVEVARANQFALSSSSGSELLGGVCGNGTAFADMLKCFVKETLPELIPHVYNEYLSSGTKSFPDPWFEEQLNITSDHRLMKYSASNSNAIVEDTPARRKTPGILFDSYLSRKDYGIALRAKDDASNPQLQTNSLNRLLERLENRGHAAAAFVEGLTCELLPFQQQSLQWAVERETTPGGLQSFFWTKLPHAAEPNKDVYYNPVLGKFLTRKPNLVRGGIIAEQMGLGKTVISLAIILQNPAPTLPATGSPVATIPKEAPETGPFWDPALYSRTSEGKEKRGSILSRGTLVVCNVSLVGQWIGEAKSKLKDPGLVYSYHGSGRKRIPEILAKNSIVVTTYETLSSDATFHAVKSEDPNYCPPCEAIRWWRVICDESHVLRGASNKSRAVLDLVADNKWLVSGTPVNTTVMDLANQFKFLGIEQTAEYMKLFKETICTQIADKSASVQNKRKRGYQPNATNSLPGFGMFSFILRSIMIRHAHGQRYTGTTTTLMSLPPKTERSIAVEFSKEEQLEYAALEQHAQSFYTNFKATKGPDKLNKYYLRVTQKLTPLRIACSGGQVPLEDESDEEDVNGGDNDNETDIAGDKPKGSKKKEKKYSEFAFTSKLKALMGELTRVREQDTAAKSLVFSQYASTLKYLQMELPKHGFEYRTLSGDMSMAKRAKALRDFQNDPPTTVFLLSMRAGAVGINLTQASCVFIMEPCFNPALEAQAIGRVHRLGQKRSVEIVRLTMENSVEGRIHKMLDKKYGSSVSASAQEDAANDEDKKPAAKANVAAIVGCLASDKTTVVADEFDLLFGVETGVSGDTPMPYAVGSTASL